ARQPTSLACEVLVIASSIGSRAGRPFLLPSVASDSLRLPVVALELESLDVSRPGQGRAAPDLVPGTELLALTDEPHPQVVPRRVLRRGRVARRAARRAERVRPLPAALRRLEVDGRLPPEHEVFGRCPHRDPEDRAGQRLAVGAVADPRRL